MVILTHMLMVLTVTYIRIDGSESFQQDQCNVSDFLVTSYSLNSCTNVVAENCTKIYDAGCGPWIDNGVDVGTYCCLSTQNNVPISGGKSVCCQYGTGSPDYVRTNSQCTDSQSAYTHGTHCASYCEYYMGTGVTIGENNMDSYGRSCKITSDRRLVMSTPQNPDAGGWIIRNYAPAETCNVTCQSGYRHDTSNPTSSYMRCMIDYACDLNSISLGNCTSNVAPSGGPYLVDATANTETSFPEYVCTENSCAAITMPTGAISASGLGSNIIMCSAELVLNTNTFPTQCLITCDAGYVYKLGALLCPADSDHNASVTTNTGESEFTCQPIRCSETINVVGTTIDSSDANACNMSASGLLRGETCTVACDAGYEPSQEFIDSGYQASCLPNALDGDSLDIVSTPCTECDRGYYSDSADNDLCLPCPKNTFADVSGRTICKECESGTESGTNSVECTACSFWYVLNTGNCDGIPIFAVLFSVVAALIILGIAYLIRKNYLEKQALADKNRRTGMQVVNLRRKHQYEFMNIWVSSQIQGEKNEDKFNGLNDNSVISVHVSDVTLVENHKGTLRTEIDQRSYEHEVFVKARTYPIDTEIDTELVRSIRKISMHSHIVIFMDFKATDKLLEVGQSMNYDDEDLQKYNIHTEEMQRLCYIFSFSLHGSLEDKLSGQDEKYVLESYSSNHQSTRARQRVDSDDIRHRVQKIDMKQRLQWLLDIATGLCWLHDNDMVHGNVQLSNVILYLPNTMEAKSSTSKLYRAKLTDMWIYRCCVKSDHTIDNGRNPDLSSLKWIPPEFSVAERKVRSYLAMRTQKSIRTKNISDSAPKELKFWFTRAKSKTNIGMSKKKKKVEEEGEKLNGDDDDDDELAGIKCISPALDVYGLGKILEMLTDGLEKQRTYKDLHSINDRRSSSTSRQSMRRSRGISVQNLLSSALGGGSGDDCNGIDIEDMKDVETRISDFRELRRATKRCLRNNPESRPSILAVRRKLQNVYNHVVISFGDETSNKDTSIASTNGIPIAHASDVDDAEEKEEEA